ncbi:LysE family translocator [Marinomonas balearica]|uniref:Threonine/homoserine/homoserine lactone efflux protein n=1 Tax=Marinomonas balearica TaxID=491947 RepID=A0A4R6MHV3_9GAMM|nr:LysE family transporter [Marinomonas balearica]TDP01275.1 threonine/homoserine/homoserine lactone efflux protein [Marinomonas balearica]
MLEIFVFAFGIMYTPGPVNMISLFAGIRGESWRALRFCAGVGSAMAIMFIGIGYAGNAIIPKSVQSVIAILGGLYIAYLGYKVMKASFKSSVATSLDTTNMRFSTGLLMQLSNPKAPVVILPVATVQFPAAHVEGIMIAIMSLALGCLAFGAPTSYLLAGNQLKQAALNPNVMKWVNRVMALLLFYIAIQFISNAITQS